MAIRRERIKLQKVTSVLFGATQGQFKERATMLGVHSPGSPPRAKSAARRGEGHRGDRAVSTKH
jgi:hypothetical protein